MRTYSIINSIASLMVIVSVALGFLLPKETIYLVLTCAIGFSGIGAGIVNEIYSQTTRKVKDA